METMKVIGDFRCIIASGTEPLTLPKLSGQANIWNSQHLFVFTDPLFKFNQLNQSSGSCSIITAMIEGAKEVEDMLRASESWLHTNKTNLLFTENQIVEFCQVYRQHLNELPLGLTIFPFLSKTGKINTAVISCLSKGLYITKHPFEKSWTPNLHLLALKLPR